MADSAKIQYQWPKNSWSILKKIIRACYTVENSGGEITQKKISDAAGVQQSQVSTNKAFLQMIGFLIQDGLSLTDAGKRFGIGLFNDNESMRRQGLELIVKSNVLLRDMLDIIKGRGTLKFKDFSDEIALRTNGKTEGFATGVTILQEILTGSGAVEVTGDTLRPIKSSFGEPAPLREPEREASHSIDAFVSTGLKRIPIAVSTESVWYVEVGEKPKPEEVQKFLEMQKLMFS